MCAVYSVKIMKILEFSFKNQQKKKSESNFAFAVVWLYCNL